MNTSNEEEMTAAVVWNVRRDYGQSGSYPVSDGVRGRWPIRHAQFIADTLNSETRGHFGVYFLVGIRKGFMAVKD